MNKLLITLPLALPAAGAVLAAPGLSAAAVGAVGGAAAAGDRLMDVRELRKRGLIATSGSWWRHWLRWRLLRYPMSRQ